MKNDSLNADNTTTKIDSLWANQQKIIQIPPLSSLKWDNRITYKKCMACSGNGSIDTRTIN